MKNKANIKGDRNFVFQGINKSKIDLNNETVESSKSKYAVIAIIVAIVGIIISIIIGWDNILNFFNK